MKKKIIIFGFIVLIITLAIIFGFQKYYTQLKNDDKKSNDYKRYLEIKESTKKAVEWNIRAQYPNCSITSNFDKKNNAVSSQYNSSFLINNGYIKQDELLDVDGENYCDVYVVIQMNSENLLDNSKKCSVAYKIYLKCSEYKDKEYINWE